MSDYQDLIRRLRQIAEGRQKQHAQTATILDPTPPVEEYVEWKAAEAITALVKERDEAYADLEATYVKAHARGKQDGLRDGERQGLEKAAICHEIWAGQLYADAQAASEVGCYPCDSNGDLSHYADLHIGHAANIRALITKEQSDGDKV